MGSVSKPSLLWSLMLVLAALMLQGCQTAGPSLPDRGGWHPAASVRSYTPDYVTERGSDGASAEALVGTDAFGIEGLSFAPMDEDDDLELTGELPADMRDYEPRPMPRVRARTRQQQPASGRPTAYAGGKNLLCTGSELMCVTSPYGVFRGTHTHKGVDLRAPFGSPIKAFRGGRVVVAQYSGAYGYMVEITQYDGLVARYAHMSQIIAHEGDHVGPGQIIGRVGSTGRSTGPHLHFELIRNGAQVNPLTQLTRPGDVLTPPSSHDAEAARAALNAGMKSRASRDEGSRSEQASHDRKKSGRDSAAAGKGGRAGADRRAEADSRRSAKAEAKDSRGRKAEQASAGKNGRKDPAASDDRKKGSRAEARREAPVASKGTAASGKGSDRKKGAESARKEQPGKQSGVKSARGDAGRDSAARQSGKASSGKASGGKADGTADAKKTRTSKDAAKKQSSGKNVAKPSAQKKGDDRPARKSGKKS